MYFKFYVNILHTCIHCILAYRQTFLYKKYKQKNMYIYKIFMRKNIAASAHEKPSYRASYTET